MQKLLHIIRVVTIACYFLPFTFLFVTCSGSNSDKAFDFAYNKKEAAENAIKDKDNGFFAGGEATTADTASTVEPATDSSSSPKNIANNADTAKNAIEDTSSKVAWVDSTDGMKSSSDGVEYALIRPVKNSESALGVLFFYKDLFGKIVIAIGLLVSLTGFVVGLFKKHNKRLLFVFMIINLLCITAFITDALLNAVNLLFGAWLCLLFTIIGLSMQYRMIKS